MLFCMQSLAATTPIVQRCSYAHNKLAQQIQFTVGRPADLDSAYFSESESVKLVYITDIQGSLAVPDYQCGGPGAKL